MDEKDVEKVVDANLNALSSQENDSNANQLILLTIGDISPLPVPVTSTIPSNILTVDILALEFSMYRRSRANGSSHMPERHGPLAGLYALLQTLQIPISPYAPLGNAGNEAFYALMAFQVMMMGSIRFPDILYQQHGHQGMAHNPYPMHPQMPYGPYGPPPPIADHRRQSSSSFLRPESFAPPAPRRASDNVRPRPSSLANSQGRRTTTGIPTMSRSQTVFWDDSEFAAENAQQVGTADDPIRGRLPPPAFKTVSSSRSISWEDSSNEQLQGPSFRTHVSSNASSPRRQSQPPVSGSASSLRLAESRSQEPALQAEVEEPKDGKDKKKGKEGKPKLKSEKSVKDIAGALARFWVG